MSRRTQYRLVALLFCLTGLVGIVLSHSDIGVVFLGVGVVFYAISALVKGGKP
jgi:hypothetical protein